MRSICPCLALALVALPGCYLFHGRDGAGSSIDAGSRRSDAVSPLGLDADDSTPSDAASSPELRDAGRPDSGPPLPREPEPDPGPDGRPSDDPDGWVDPPDLDPEEPCCVLGDPVLVTSREAGTALAHEPPRVAWRPGRWALAATRYFERSEGSVFRLVVFELDPDGRPLGEARVLDTPFIRDPSSSSPSAEGFRWAAGRWAFAAGGEGTAGSARETHVRLFDAAWAPASEWLPIGESTAADVAYLAHGDRWLAFTSFADGLRATPVDELEGLGRAIESPGGWSHLVRAASFGSRAAVLPVTAETMPDLVVVDPEGAELGRVARSPQAPDGSMAALRDLAVLATRRDDRVEVEVIDPFTSSLLIGPTFIGSAGSADALSSVRAVDIAGSSKFGVAGVCWGVPSTAPGRGEGDSQILFRLVGPDGRPRGAAMTVVSSPFRGSAVGCTVGTDQRGFLVGWWNGSELWVRRVDVAE